jgi:hypothetical protein
MEPREGDHQDTLVRRNSSKSKPGSSPAHDGNPITSALISGDVMELPSHAPEHIAERPSVFLAPLQHRSTVGLMATIEFLRSALPTQSSVAD